LAGLVIEIVGVFFTASRFTKLLWYEIPWAFISSLWEGEAAKGAADIGETLVGDRPLEVLQGITLIGLGLIIQAVGVFGTPHKPGEVPDSTGTTLSVISNNLEAIKTQLETMGATLSANSKTLEAIKTQFETAGAALSLIPNTLNRIGEQMLDMRIAQSVNLSYLTGPDCRRVQQALSDLRFYNGKVDEKCGGATNAAAQEWQIQNRRTIAPAHSADQILKSLGTQSEQSVNTGR
jgi:hypothetical protein